MSTGPLRAPAEAAIPSTSERYISAGGVRVRYLYRAGSAPGSAIVLIHGLLGFSYSWRHNIEALSRLGDVYATDLPGVGYSERAADFDCSLAGFGNFVLAFAEGAGIGNFDLIGTSHGGAVAIAAADADLARNGFGSRRIRRLVLVAPVNPWSGGNHWVIRIGTSTVGRFCIRGARPLLVRGHEVFLRRVYGDPARMEPGVSRAYSLPIGVPGTIAHLSKILKCWRADVASLGLSLEKIRRVPALLVWGSRDAAISPASAEPLAKCFDQAEIRMIESAGHLPNEELPEEFNRAVSDFLKKR